MNKVDTSSDDHNPFINQATTMLKYWATINISILEGITMKLLHIMLAVVLSVLIFIQIGSFNAIANGEDDEDDEHGHCGGWGGGPWWGFWMMFVMFGGILFFFFIFPQILRNGPVDYYQQFNRSIPRNNALLLLDERYARGEIPKDEYVKMKEDLKR